MYTATLPPKMAILEGARTHIVLCNWVTRALQNTESIYTV
jgi:uncharacterized protein YodC (DUF2158 family)